MKYDALLFGNGLTLCYQKQIQEFVPEKYGHCLYIGDYIDAIIEERTTIRELNNLKKVFKEGYNYSYDVIVQEFTKLKNDFKNGYEWSWGKLLTSPNVFEKYRIVIDCLPIIYNMWYCNLKSLIDNKLDLEYTSKNFTRSLQQHLQKSARLFTTNFDGFFDCMKPEHLHGHFREDFSSYRDLCCFKTSQTTFYYPFIWAPSEVGKMKMIEKFTSIKSHVDYYDFRFFHSPVTANNLLVFGLSFAEAGYMEGLKDYNPKYNKYSFGSCIDDHILVRLKTLQERYDLGKITFAFYDDLSKQHYEKIIVDYNLPNADVIPSSSFDLQV